MSLQNLEWILSWKAPKSEYQFFDVSVFMSMPGNTRGGERLVNINTEIKEEQVNRTIAKKTSGRVVMPSVLLGKRDNPSQSGQMQMK